MWSYYGSKTELIDLYPAPLHKKIIEPFAGSARYSLRYWDREIIICDRYEVVIKIWRFLQQCSPSDILRLPRPTYGQRLSDFKIEPEGARLLMGFVVGYGEAVPRDKISKKILTRPNFINFSLGTIAKNLHKIKHWQVIHGTYKEMENQPATWFIDPPYMVGGGNYRHSNKKLNYADLAAYCMTRYGQVIVCEGSGAAWLPFKPLKFYRGQSEHYQEQVYYQVNQEKKEYWPVQGTLF